MLHHVKSLLTDTGYSLTTISAYDTAWVARLNGDAHALSSTALARLREHQLPDGGWGAERPLHYHNRLLSTLGAVIALAEHNLPADQERIARGIQALETYVSRLEQDAMSELVGFEMLMSPLFEEASRRLGLRIPNTPYIRKILHRREKKLASIPKGKISAAHTASYSAEMAGAQTDFLDVDNLLLPNHSVCCSPAATAYYVKYIHPSEDALGYLQEWLQFMEAGMPFTAPIDIFERSFVLRYLMFSERIREQTRTWMRPHLEYLFAAWRPGKGVGWSCFLSLYDSDDSAVTYRVLRRARYPVDDNFLRNFFTEDGFSTYPMELSLSISSNVHVLEVLPPGTPAVDTVLRLLRSRQSPQGFWLDKWHVSPAYPTAEAVVAGMQHLEHPLAAEMFAQAVHWFLSIQRADGGWGSFGESNKEESAYALLALLAWMEHRSVDESYRRAVSRGAHWLAEHRRVPLCYRLWASKTLYSPVRVIEAAVLGALARYEEMFGQQVL